jgi:hypothetical protein
MEFARRFSLQSVQSEIPGPAQIPEKLPVGLEMAPKFSRTGSGSIEQGCYLHHVLSA